MPRLDAEQDDMQTQQIAGSSYGYSGTRMERLLASQYTIAEVLVDTSGSTHHFVDELRNMVETAVEALRGSPRADNLLVRVSTFNSVKKEEIHGYKLLSSIVDDYKPFTAEGGTPLADATYEALKAIEDYATELRKNEYDTNAIFFAITDGAETGSTATPAMIKQLVEDLRQREVLESIVLILIRINAGYCKAVLDSYRDDCGFDGDIDVANATPKELQLLAKFITNSISSTSQALGSGGPSRNIAASI